MICDSSGDLFYLTLISFTYKTYTQLYVKIIRLFTYLYPVVSPINLYYGATFLIWDNTVLSLVLHFSCADIALLNIGKK